MAAKAVGGCGEAPAGRAILGCELRAGFADCSAWAGSVGQFSLSALAMMRSLSEKVFVSAILPLKALSLGRLDQRMRRAAEQTCCLTGLEDLRTHKCTIDEQRKLASKVIWTGDA